MGICFQASFAAVDDHPGCRACPARARLRPLHKSAFSSQPGCAKRRFAFTLGTSTSSLINIAVRPLKTSRKIPRNGAPLDAAAFESSLPPRFSPRN
jgi:hypothetical protein